ncbi:MAG: exodeoxyribonuclease VII large subunit [Tannerella sp.]|jgi:exodeoxyribonuclease VII large subunit|nr:exodeoxyribonuclease VII large subunit [Tannerella sp.]
MKRFDYKDSSEALSLSELNEQVSEAIKDLLPGTYWIKAETSDVRVNASSGHCYLEFVEKEKKTGRIVAKARGTIWVQTYDVIKRYFEESTGQIFVSGLKVLVNVSVEFHKLYGYSLTIHEIDPAYTIGDLIKRRMEIVRLLQEEGVFDLNRELPFPYLPQRIAVVTSPTAAGYEDFVDQLLHNKAGYPFYLKLFPAIMQGDKAEESIIDALDRICTHIEYFDVVVIIRGGGSTSDLNCFDSYLVSAHCAQFPLPVITGIGHERDDSVVDMVAHTRMKTPTAVAAFLIEYTDEQANELNILQQLICARASEILSDAQKILNRLATSFPSIVGYIIERKRSQLLAFSSDVSGVRLYVEKNNSALTEIGQKIMNRLMTLFSQKNQELNLHEQYLKMASPDYILKKGYTLTLKEGKTVKLASELITGDQVMIRFADGERNAGIK